MKATRRDMMRVVPAFLASSALAGCTSPPTNYYRIAAIPGAIRSGAPKAVLVRSVSIPGYLDQNGIAKPGGNYQFNVFSNDIWAGSLSGMLQAVLVQNLSQRLPDTIVIGSGGSIGASADLLVETNILSFEPDSTGNIILNAQFAMRSGTTRALWLTQSFQSDAKPSGQTASDIVAAMSTLWAAASDEVTGLIVQSWASHAS